MGFIQTGRQSGRLSRRPAKRIKLAPRKSLTLGGEHTRSSVGSSQNSSGVQITQPISILERLPQEIMMKVFIDVGVTDNEIPLLNKYFYSLFKFNTSGRDGGVGFIEALVKRHFTFNLNENLNVDAVIEKVIRYREKFLTSNSPVAVSSSFQEIELTLNFYKETQTVINTELFNRKFVSENFLEMTNIRYMKVLSAEMILKEMIMRPLYIRKELKSLIEKLKALPETEEEAMALVAQELFEGTSSTISVTDSSNSTDGLKDYSPTNISEAPDFLKGFIVGVLDLNTFK